MTAAPPPCTLIQGGRARDEVVAALARRTPKASDEVIQNFQSSVERGHFEIAEITPDLLDRTIDIAYRRRLRGYDAVKLTVGMQLHALRRRDEESVILVSADEDLNNAAKAEGFHVINPITHESSPSGTNFNEP